MKLFFQAVVSVTLTTITLFLVVMVFTVNFTEPELNAVQLSPDERSDYYQKVRSLVKKSSGSFEVQLTARQTTHFFQQYVTGRGQKGFKLTGFRLRRGNGQSLVNAVVQGPIGLYYQLEARGSLHLSQADKKLKLVDFYLGPIPLAWIFNYVELTDYMQLPADDNFQLKELRVNASGLYLRGRSRSVLDLDWLG